MRPRLLDNAASGSRIAPPHLSIDSNRFTFIDSAGEKKPHDKLTIDIVVIDLNFAKSKMYWGKPYNEQEAGKDIPVCWSDNGTAPSIGAQTPQSETCLLCPHNQVGSAISTFSGAKIKLCVDMKKIAFVVPGDPQNIVYLLTVKPGSFKAWDTYVALLKRQFGPNADLPDVVTRVSFASQGRLQFDLTPSNTGGPALVKDYPTVAAQLEAAWARNVTDDIVGRNDVPYSGQLAAPAAQPALTAPVPFAQTPTSPIMSGLTAATAPEPVKRTRGRAKGATAENGFQAPSQHPPQAPFMAQPSPQPAPAVPPQQSAPTPPAAAAETLDIPPFLQRQQAPQPPLAGQASAPAQGFGMATPAAPDADMQTKIAAAFNLPT